MYTEMINVDNIFSLFSENEELDGVNSKVQIDFSQTPIYWVGMYKKIVLNHINFNKKVLKFFKEANEELDVEDVKEAGEFVVYHRAWHYIQNVNIDNVEHIIAIEKYADEYLDIALKLGISFFEQYEEYEKCALLKKILDKVKKFQS